MERSTFSFSIILFFLFISCGTENKPIHNFTATASPEIGGTISPSFGQYEEGETLEVTATPTDGWLFSRWEGDLIGSDNPIQFKINKEYNVIGVFTRKDYTLNIIIVGEGTVQERIVSSPKTTDYPFETVVELTAVDGGVIDNEFWEFSGWSGDIIDTENPTTIEINSEKTITATFTAKTLTTSPITDIRVSTAQSGGEIPDGWPEITARGVVWSTSENPTLDANDGFTEDGSGTGSFTSELSGLSPDTRYYVRAYATNSAGTSYGNDVEFTTEDESWQRDSETEVVEVTSPTGRVWMDRNLGASRAAESSTDEQAYGDLYQWGRAADGHQVRTSPTTTTLSSSDQPGHGEFILAPDSPRDWRSPRNDNLWQGVNGINNPCPVGYRVPTEAEWNDERNSWSSNNASGAFNSPLKLPVAGNRGFSSGSLLNVGSFGIYWSGTVSGSNARRLFFDSSLAGMVSFNRADGRSVRCLKDTSD